MNYDKNDINSILKYAMCLENKSLINVLGSIDFNATNNKGKGKLGQLVEEKYFGYKLNSKKEADFKEVGVELKVAPLKKIKIKKTAKTLREQRGIGAKERVVLSVINYMEIKDEVWGENSLMKKCGKLLLMFYFANKEKMIEEQVFELISLWEPSQADLNVIEKDWNIIMSKIKSGQAHKISEGDTMYLGACTKGATAEKSKREQPFSDELAPQRAFCFKNAYVNSIINELLERREYKKREKGIVLSTEKSFDDVILERLNRYEGKDLNYIIEGNGIERNRNSKNFLSQVANDLFISEFGGAINEIEELKKSNIEVRTVLMNEKGNIKESMSFDLLDYCELSTQTWEESKIRERFENKKILWVAFKARTKYKKQIELDLNQIEFYKVKFWNMSIEDLDVDMQYVWSDTVKKIKENRYDEFIKISDKVKFHIRNKDLKSKDCVPTPQGHLEKKRAFWLNSDYIREQIEKED